jgi:hypothetical protein
MSSGPTWRETMDRLAANQWPSLREIRKLRDLPRPRSNSAANLASNVNTGFPGLAVYSAALPEQGELRPEARNAREVLRVMRRVMPNNDLRCQNEN